uniref:N-acetylneuraminate lyase n=1 Tax=Cacopsylla melanoneura TaxID=428564 RepID=A0A8D8XD60_9HEMI
MVKFTFEGLMAPVFTAFTEQNELNVDIVPAYAEFLAKNGVKSILVNGTTGEGIQMSTEERKANLEAWMKVSARHSFTVMVQIGGTAFVEVLKLAKHAAHLNVHALLCLPELFFYPQSDSQLVQYLAEVSHAAPNVPLFYYHIPQFTRIVFDMELFTRKCVADIPSFCGIKFTHTNLEELQRMNKVDPERLTFFLGCDQLILPGLVCGINSHINTSLSLFPNTLNKICTAYKQGNLETARESQDQLTDVLKQITAYGSWMSSLKPNMKFITGLDFGSVRKPLEPLPPQIVAKLKAHVDTFLAL